MGKTKKPELKQFFFPTLGNGISVEAENQEQALILANQKLSELENPSLEAEEEVADETVKKVTDQVADVNSQDNQTN